MYGHQQALSLHSAALVSPRAQEALLLMLFCTTCGSLRDVSKCRCSTVRSHCVYRSWVHVAIANSLKISRLSFEPSLGRVEMDLEVDSCCTGDRGEAPAVSLGCSAGSILHWSQCTRRFSTNLLRSSSCEPVQELLFCWRPAIAP